MNLDTIMSEILGLGSDNLSLGEALLRAAIVYAGALFLVRLGEKRFLGKSTAFDMVVAVMLGSVVSRGINAGAPLLPSLAAGAMLLGMHWLMAAIAFRSDWLGDQLKGTARVLVKDGEPRREAMRKSHITDQDLMGGLRESGNIDDLEKVRIAYLERRGDITVVEKTSEPKIIEIKVEEGVQIVRVELTS